MDLTKSNSQDVKFANKEIWIPTTLACNNPCFLWISASKSFLISSFTMIKFGEPSNWYLQLIVSDVVLVGSGRYYL